MNVALVQYIEINTVAYTHSNSNILCAAAEYCYCISIACDVQRTFI